MKKIIDRLKYVITNDIKHGDNYTVSFALAMLFMSVLAVVSFFVDSLISKGIFPKPVFFYGIMNKFYDLVHMSGMTLTCIAVVLFMYFVFIVSEYVSFDKE